MRTWESRSIPGEFDYVSITAMSHEAREKLASIRPANVGQASRIPGVTPADLSILVVHLERVSAKQRSEKSSAENRMFHVEHSKT